MPGRKRRSFLPEENLIIERYTRALAAGRYRFRREATTDCLEELSRLYERIGKSDPSHKAASQSRSFDVVSHRLRAQLRKKGLSWVWTGLGPAEAGVVERYAAALVAGTYPGARRAAEACYREIRLLPSKSRPVRPRTPATIYRYLLKAAHELCRPPNSRPRSRPSQADDGQANAVSAPPWKMRERMDGFWMCALPALGRRLAMEKVGTKSGARFPLVLSGRERALILKAWRDFPEVGVEVVNEVAMSKRPALLLSEWVGVRAALAQAYQIETRKDAERRLDGLILRIEDLWTDRK
jgi:hypothetical protein